jgi:hypothetical protein
MNVNSLKTLILGTSGKFTDSLKQGFADEEVRFRLVTMLKLTIVPLMTFLILLGFILILLRINLSYFSSFGFPNIAQLKDNFYSHILNSLYEILPYSLIFVTFLMITGLYLSHLMLRPFRSIEKYCNDFTSKKTAEYDPDFFSDLKLLTSFSEYFFSIAENSLKTGHVIEVKIPAKFTRIHAPVFESSFFINFFLILVITSIIAGSAIHITTITIYEELIKLAIETLPNQKSVAPFFSDQMEILTMLSIITLIVHIMLYVALSFNLYSKVAIPAFGIFATMRSFLKGKHTSRVHLLGHYYVRNQCRALNKYLDLISDLSK